MIIKYRMLSSITMQQFRDDIVGLIAGTITNVSGLSAGCDKANSSISGTYPNGIYALVNSSSNTFSKIHSTDASTIDYFRLGFGANSLQSISLAQGYTAGTDTLINSVANTVNIFPNAYNPNYYASSSGLTITLTNSCVHFTSLASGTSFGIHDLGENGITANYPPSMKMAFIRLDNSTFTIPYTYTVQGRTSAFATLGSLLSLVQTNTITSGGPSIQSNLSANSTIIVESPVFVFPSQQSGAVYGVLNLFRIPLNSINMDYQYTANGVSRQVAFSYSIPTE